MRPTVTGRLFDFGSFGCDWAGQGLIADGCIHVIDEDALRFIEDPPLLSKGRDAAREVVAKLHPSTVAARQLASYERVAKYGAL